MGFLKYVPQEHACTPPGSIDFPTAGVGSIWECEVESCGKQWEVVDRSMVGPYYTMTIRTAWQEVVPANV